MKTPKTVAIMDGVAEGRWHHKLLDAELVRAGFKVQSDVITADIIISHSAGCFFLPHHNKRQLILLIDPPYWPGKLLAVSFGQKIWHDFSARLREGNLLYLLQKTGWNIFYIFSDTMHVVQIFQHARKRNFYEAFTDDNVILIRNEHDAWCSPTVKEQLSNLKFQFYTMSGEHDDCWIHPAPYVELLHSL